MESSVVSPQNRAEFPKVPDLGPCAYFKGPRILLTGQLFIRHVEIGKRKECVELRNVLAKT